MAAVSATLCHYAGGREGGHDGDVLVEGCGEVGGENTGRLSEEGGATVGGYEEGVVGGGL